MKKTFSKLMRSRKSERYYNGVLSGLSSYIGVNPMYTRYVFVLLMAFPLTIFVIPLYLAIDIFLIKDYDSNFDLILNKDNLGENKNEKNV